MKKWGLVVTLFFIVVVVGVLMPAGLLLALRSTPDLADYRDMYQAWGVWIPVGVILLGQVLLLWLRVDTTQPRLKPRTHVLISVITTGLLMAVLTADVLFAVGVAIRGDKLLDPWSDAQGWSVLIGSVVLPWLVWGILFYRLWRDSTDPVTKAVAWLLRGSVLELLIAVPAHVIVRRRNDCSAPVATSFGITTGIAIMLISFGPSVLLLYKKRMEGYSRKASMQK